MSADLIEGYLDRLLGHLRGSAHDVRRILAETEEHLRDATAELVAAGSGWSRSGSAAWSPSCSAGCSGPGSWPAICPA